MKKVAKKTLIRVSKAIVYGVVGALTMLLVLAVYLMNRKADLKVWHTVKLDEEFTASSKVEDFTEYLALEERLFAQLDREVYARIAPEDQQVINRYYRGSLSDPGSLSPNWNRSYELAADSGTGKPKTGVLLIHGLSDSPYSLRVLGESLHAGGAHVVGLRVPGHGTAPSALTRTTWKDMAAAVVLAMRHLKAQVGEQPIHVVGYSNGGALAVHYALSTMEDPDLPRLDGMVLISPEIGVSSMAALAIWQERIGRITGLKKLAWTGVLPEYDPYKYSSFPVNAGNLAYKLTGVNRATLARLSTAGKLGGFPRVLAFQSAVDATVSAPALVRDLFARLPEGGHELVVFDLNRMANIGPLLKKDPKDEFPRLRDDPARAYTISLVSNETDQSERVIVRQWKPREATFTKIDIGLTWPAGLYSLAHVALPFREDDPVYGGAPPEGIPGIHLGSLALRGEKGVLQVPAADMLRLRWNPFYPYLEQRALDHVHVVEP
jgi:alpha-beta hydrolase superfamily lysophospholipase